MERQDLASLSDRLFGQILDSLIAFAPFIPAGILVVISPSLGMLAIVAAGGYAFYYILFADGFEGGQSYGKRFVNTAVIDGTTGEPCTFWQSFLRNVPLMLLGVIDWVFIFGQRRQRLGDKLANTFVVKTQPLP